MLGSLLRLIQPTTGRQHDHLFTPFAPEGAPASVLHTLFDQYAYAMADEVVPAQHKHYRAFVLRTLGPSAAAIRWLDGLNLRRVTSAYVTCFERSEPFEFQLSLWRKEPHFRAALLQLRADVITDLVSFEIAEAGRRRHFHRWKECVAAPIDIAAENTLGLIQQMTPDDWHEIALRWNWDHGVTELNWITSQRACDRATALYVLCAGSPGDVAQGGARRAGDQAGFIRALASRLENGFYAEAALRLELPLRLRAGFQRQLDTARATGESPWLLPEGLLDHDGARDAAPRYSITDGRVHYHYEHWLAHIADR